MPHLHIVVLDGGHARFFTFNEGAPVLIELGALQNPEHMTPGHELYSSSKTGQRFRSDGQPNSVDDHRNAHDAEMDRRFAKQVADEMSRRARAADIKRLLVVATPKMMGCLSEHLAHLVKQGFEVKRDEKELSRLSPFEIHAHLAKEGLVPAEVRKERKMNP